MATNKFIEIALFPSTHPERFYAGTGFFIAMGGNPAIKLMSDKTVAEYWQHTDHFMTARMKFFDPLLLLSLLLSPPLLLKAYRTPSLWFMLLSFGILVADTILIFTTNHPLNAIVQGCDLGKLPSNVQE